MNQDQQYGMQCTEFEVLLTEAVEGTLSEGQMQSFRAHAATCAMCAASFAEAAAGYQQLRSLEPIEVPATLAHNILVATTGVAPTSAPTEVRAHQSWKQRLWSWLRPAIAPMLQPRMAGTFAMAFFSVTVMLNLAGVDLRYVDLRPGAVRGGLTHTYFATKSRVVRYYDSMRIVYELQARMRELRNLLPEENTQPQPQERQEKKEKNKDISVQPQPGDKQKEENYAQQSGNALLASYTLHQFRPPYFSVERNRRRTA